jgi:hypothetical protein
MFQPEDSKVTRNLILLWIVLFLSIFSAFKCSEARGAEFRLLDVDYFDMRAAKFGINRDPLTPDIEGHQYVGRVATDFQLRILEVGYWKNEVHTEGTEGQLQTVGWHYEMGVRLHKSMSAFYEHHSRHRMDSANVIDYNRDLRPDRFPVEDSYGIRLHFYINPRPERSIF